jgi:hypothetical protein
MNDILMILLKISLVIFMAGNLLDMGLRLNPQEALRGLRNVRFVGYVLLRGFVRIDKGIPWTQNQGTGGLVLGL